MTEKQFRITTNPKSNAVAFDEKQKKHYIGIDLEDLLNEQQAMINKKYGENIKDYDRNLLKEFVLFYKEFDGYENSSELKGSELDLIDLFLGERYG